MAMKNALRRVLGRRTSLLAALAVVAAPLVFPGSANAQYVSAGAAEVPGNALTSFDISSVSGVVNEYFLSDRSNLGIDVIPIEPAPPVFQIIPAFPNVFAGPQGGNNSIAGPNGNITFIDPLNPEGLQLWVGNGPTANPVCAGTNCSTVFVFSGPAATLTHVINTGGVMRADENCWAPANPAAGRANGLQEIANDSPPDLFDSFIPTSGSLAYTIVAKFSAASFATNGIEGCIYDPTTDELYNNIPEVLGPGNDTEPGAVLVFDPTFPGVLVTDFYPINIEACAGNQGIALGNRFDPLTPGSTGDGNLLLGCNAPSIGGPFAGLMNTISINDVTGDITNFFENLGGNDEVYHTETPAVVPASPAFVGVTGDWFLAGGSFLPVQQVGIVNPGTATPGSAFVINVIPTGFPGGSTRRTHSVASWAGNAGTLGSLEAAIFPVPATGGGSPGFQSTLCTTAAAHGCIAFYLQSPIVE
jgi:hypothetical protein